MSITVIVCLLWTIVCQASFSEYAHPESLKSTGKVYILTATFLMGKSMHWLRVMSFWRTAGYFFFTELVEQHKNINFIPLTWLNLIKVLLEKWEYFMLISVSYVSRQNCSRLTVTVLKITIYVYEIVILFYLDNNLFLFRL